ncbi:ABC transporter permease [Arthrobacter cupressi]|uniref:Putative ABC transport system permease protein n=1 Tax=Arthrobacter cupressi TaxID=1045773 RepID=A0A1G8UAP7_9MICC|nr:ABC transporter permease [Arthrobacter cupressi]NYD76524.1 putative ABC transport system permease protein [Arthrobacter cupressi]SDJ50829.1 putative ABC transport system permease protein [Arthrobacter cupressi]
MLRVSLSQLTTQFRRFIAIGLAVMLAVAFLSSTLMVGASTQASLGASVGEAYRKAQLVVTPQDGKELSQEAVDAAASAPAVAESYAERYATVTIDDGGEQLARVRNLASPAMEPSVLLSGRYPAAADEAAVDSRTAERLKLSPGSELTAGTTGAPEAGGKPGTRTFRITGLLQPSNDPFSAPFPQLLAPDGTVASLAPGNEGFTGLQLSIKDGQDESAARDYLGQRLKAAGAGDALVQTSGEKVTAAVAQMSGGQDQLTIILLAFAGVAVVVSTLVVANTFSVLLAQRTRELALLRCLGAGRAQIRASVLFEAGVLGLVSSVLGVLAGAGLMSGLIAWARTGPEQSFATLAVPPSAIIAGLLAGTLLTVIAALLPAKAATAVAPLAALRPADDASLRNKRGRARLWLGIALLVVSVPLLVLGAMFNMLFVAMPAGALSFVGVLLCASLFIPPVVAAAGRLAAPAGVPGKLAAVNAVRNPARTSATAAALLIGVTLVTLMMTGAATSRQAFDAMLAENYPVDLAVRIDGDPRTDEAAVRKVWAFDGVQAAVLLQAAGTITAPGTAADGSPVFAISSGDAAAVLRDPGLRPQAGTVYLPERLVLDRVTIAGPGGTHSFAGKVLRTGNIESLMDSTTAATLLGAPAPGTTGPGSAQELPRTAWLKLDDGLSADRIQAIQREAAAAFGVPVHNVSGAAVERVVFNSIIDVLLLVVTALLGIAVVIALIGVANTLSLSVLERTRENSLLRALGLTRGQLRGMLALEAVLVAGVAAVLGSALGTAYGWLGAKAALGPVAEVVPVVPWLQLLGVFAVAVVAGLLASVLPARRAARLSPVQGLATT